MINILSGGLLFVVAVVLLREFRLAMTSIRTERWRRTSGSLADATVSGEVGDFGIADIERDLVYTYEAEGESYKSNFVGYGFPVRMWQYLARDSIAEIMAEAPSLTVYYNPRKPEDSVLICGYQRFHLIRLLPCLMLLLIAAVGFFYSPIPTL